MIPHHAPGPGPRTLLSKKRSEIAKALLEHGLDEGTVKALLDFARRNRDGQIMRAKVAWDGTTWAVEMFGPRRDAA